VTPATAKPVFFPAPAAFRTWLEVHHMSRDALIVGFYKRHSGRPSMTWPESVDEALCFGWIDGVRRTIDEDRYTIRFTPRRARSTWSLVNIARVAELARLGRLHPAGEAAFAARRDEGVYSYEQRRNAELDTDADQRFRRARRAWAFFESQPPSYRRTAVFWVMSAKREATRASRLATLIRDSDHGLRIGPLRPPQARH
jgi:uncharacterized protein YdeI (YjbR/CyaY-like superfamily)